MTRIVVDPEELKRLATYIDEAGVAYSGIAADLAAREMPDMPPVLAEAVAAGIERVIDRLGELRTRLDGTAYLLRTRAAIVDGDGSARLLLEMGRDLDG